MTFIPFYILILFVAIIIDYIAGIWIEDQSDPKKRKRYLLISVVSTCLLLAVFKYFNFFIGNINALSDFLGWNYSINVLEIILPIGLSFHTFQSLSYVIEVYYGRQIAERNFWNYSLYVMFYPQLVAGPIERPQNVLHQFYRKHEFDYKRIVEGLRLMLWGLFKKVVIADRLAVYVNEVYKNHDQYDGSILLIASVFFAYQIYCDFSGYSDIAIGSARVLGFDLMKNFNRPYSSKSIKEFWSRWHISLSTWFRDYLYIPLGGNKVPKLKWFRNLFLTFLISGFWHGANWTFIVWGALHGFYLILEIVIGKIIRKFSLISKVIYNTIIGNYFRWVLTMSLVVLAWIFFRSENINESFDIISRIFTIKTSNIDYYVKSWFYFKIEFFLSIILIVFSESINNFLIMEGDINTALQNKNVVFRWGFYLLISYSLIWFGYFSTTSDFIYFQF